MKRIHYQIFYLIALLAPTQLFATNKHLSSLPDLTFSAYVDTSYNYLSRKNVFTSGTLVRANDIEPNGFTLQQAAFTLANQPKQGFGALLNIIAGRDANQISPAGWNPYFGSQTLAINPEQLFIQYAAGPFTIMGGKYPALIGYESNNPTENINFSFSPVSTFAEPSTVQGIRGTYSKDETLSVSIGAHNGFDTLHHATRLQTFELSTQWQPRPILSTTLSLYSGKQYMTDRLANGPVGIRNFASFFAVLKANDKLKFIIDADYGIQSKGLMANGRNSRVVWSGVSGYINYFLTERWYTTVRSDLLSDQDGFRTGVRQCIKDLTLTLGFMPVKHVVIRAEARHDFSNTNSFVNINSVGTSNNLQSFALEGLYIFS